ncbi:MAG: universal stress protein [Anaerolineales bacterium]
MRILMCTDGTPLADRAIRFSAPLAQAARADVTLLGLLSSSKTEARVRASLEQARQLLSGKVEERMRRRSAREILAEAADADYGLIVFGSRGRRGWKRVVLGSIATELVRYARVPVLLFKGKRVTARRVLACTSGDVRGERVARWGGQVAQWLGAELAVLHVMSQIALSPESKVDELYETAEEAIERRTREGEHLARELELAGAHGFPTAQPKLRHGLVVEEVVAEVEEGDYDLVIIGGHLSLDLPGIWGRLRDYLLADVADEIISALNRPVLVVKGN